MTETTSDTGNTGGMGGETSAGGVQAQGSDAAADAALTRAAEKGDGAAGSRTAPDEPTTAGESWRAGSHYLAQLPVEMQPVRAIDVVALGFDDAYQEAAALAKVRSVVEHSVRFDALADRLAEVLPSDEHGAFRAELTAPEDGHATGEIRLVHEHPEADDEGEPGSGPA